MSCKTKLLKYYHKQQSIGKYFHIKKRKTMATVYFQVLQKNNLSNIYCRLVNGRKTDVRRKIDIYVNPKYWDFKHQKIKNVIVVKNRDQINNKLTKLKMEIIDRYNLDFMEGEIIDGDWMSSVIETFFNRPKIDKATAKSNHTLYYVEFAEWWVENKSKLWLTSAGNYMCEREKKKYTAFINLVKLYAGKNRIKLGSSGNSMINEFILFLHKNGYAEKTIKRHANRVKFFFARAGQEGFKIDPSYQQRVFIPKSEEVLDVVLSVVEIESIFSLKLNNLVLDNARDNFIIACWTGLRVSDYLNKLDISNFIDGNIFIKTTKTKTDVVIPVHPMVKRILIKHKGKLPKSVNAGDFNKQIKEVCELAGINKETKGRVYKKEVKRKVLDLYKKYELVCSHTPRRSFATNHFGKLPNSTIMGICGWSSESMLLEYVKKGNMEHATQLKEYWEKSLKIG